MDKEAAEILERAVRLPEKARAAIADCLLDSLDTDVDENAEEIWWKRSDAGYRKSTVRR
jgi:hypothetical protein